jgi:signal transduction histidine kinase
MSAFLKTRIPRSSSRSERRQLQILCCGIFLLVVFVSLLMPRSFAPYLGLAVAAMALAVAIGQLYIYSVIDQIIVFERRDFYLAAAVSQALFGLGLIATCTHEFINHHAQIAIGFGSDGPTNFGAFSHALLWFSLAVITLGCLPALRTIESLLRKNTNAVGKLQLLFGISVTTELCLGICHSLRKITHVNTPSLNWAILALGRATTCANYLMFAISLCMACITFLSQDLEVFKHIYGFNSQIWLDCGSKDLDIKPACLVAKFEVPQSVRNEKSWVRLLVFLPLLLASVLLLVRVILALMAGLNVFDNKPAEEFQFYESEQIFGFSLFAPLAVAFIALPIFQGVLLFLVEVTQISSASIYLPIVLVGLVVFLNVLMFKFIKIYSKSKISSLIILQQMSDAYVNGGRLDNSSRKLALLVIFVLIPVSAIFSVAFRDLIAVGNFPWIYVSLIFFMVACNAMGVVDLRASSMTSFRSAISGAEDLLVRELAHEIHNPLYASGAFLNHPKIIDVLAGVPIAAEKLKELEQLRSIAVKEFKQGLNVLDQVKERGAGAFAKLSEFDLVVIVDSIIRNYRTTLESAHDSRFSGPPVEYKYEILFSRPLTQGGQTMPVIVQADSVLLASILRALLDNAIEATSKNVRNVINVAVSFNAWNCFIDIKDTGRGMSIDQKDRFGQIQRSDKISGTGLGTSAAFRFSKSIGVELRLISSEFGFGTHVQLVFAAPLTT